MGENEVVATCQFLVVQARREGKPFRRTFWVGDYSYRRNVPPLSNLTPLAPGRRWLGYVSFIILGLILAPLSHSLWPAAGIHCPYM